MEIRFKDKKIQELCQKQAVAVRKLGDPCARKLRARLQDLESARTVGELLRLHIGNPHPLKGDRSGEFAINLAGGWRLVFTAANDPRPALPGGATDWTKVTIIRIEEVVDYHD